MAKITKMTRADVRTISEAAKLALQGVADQFGLTLTVPGGRFSDEAFDGRYSMALQGEDGVPADFTRNCGRFGLKPEHFGATFTSNGKTFKISGINTRCPKYPVSAKRVPDGKGFKFTAQQVLNSVAPAGGTGTNGITLGAQVTFESQFEGNAVGTVQSFLGNNRAEVFTTTGQTRTPQVSTLIVATRKRTEDEILDDIISVYGSLSPESLTRNGELSDTEASRRNRTYNKALKGLFEELGREVSEAGAYAHASTPRAS